MTTLKDLAAMLDSATGPSRELDVAAFRALFPYTRVYEAHCPPLTSSIDAALALVERLLPGWGWQINIGAYAILRPPKATCWSSSLCFDGDAPTAPLAILKATVAALIA